MVALVMVVRVGLGLNALLTVDWAVLEKRRSMLIKKCWKPYEGEDIIGILQKVHHV